MDALNMQLQHGQGGSPKRPPAVGVKPCKLAQARRRSVAQAAQAKEEEARTAVEQKLARISAQAAAAVAQRGAEQARLRREHEAVEEHWRQALERRCMHAVSAWMQALAACVDMSHRLSRGSSLTSDGLVQTRTCCTC